ncbi:MAG: thioredoxin family protein [Armatimonadetes bacterium]|nr:thioredoxin family protein [Armatimonadota bacterium]MDW8121130.1 thioredoxin family protein [Armatimonadota bacterium]
MALISERDKKKLTGIFSEGLVRPVRLVVFTVEPRRVWSPFQKQCHFCEETVALVQEVSQLSPLIHPEIHDMDKEEELAKQMGVDKVPGLIVTDKADRYNIRYFGIPAGLEFSALVEDILMVSSGRTQLPEEIRSRIRQVSSPVHIQVFVTPTCPYCPRAVRTAHQFAMENPLIVADMVEATQFPDLADRYQVMAVPKVVINDTLSFDGALPDPIFALAVLKAADQMTDQESDQWREVENQLRAAHLYH